MKFEPVIGLEIHAQLATRTKMFCSCSTQYTQQPNTNTCPVCYGMPGALPTINERAVRFAIMLGLALNCRIRTDSQFARKNYFYPDLPKAYQISQYDLPICENGWLDIEVNGGTKRIGITRIHMEEDAGKLIHDGSDPAASYVDLNRSGIPLLEIVSEPDLRSSEESKRYMEKIHSIVTALEICRGDMEKGNLRCDANISLRPQGTKKFGTRTETKNLNSFRFVQQAIDYEIARQTDELLDGGTIYQETRLYDSVKRVTYGMRSKENSEDYRYFPCPDLPRPKFSESLIEDLRAQLPELPDQRVIRFQEHYGLSKYDASVLCSQKPLTDFFEDTIAQDIAPKTACNWITGEFSRLLREKETNLSESRITPEKLADLIRLIEQNVISGKIAKTVFEEMFAGTQTAEQIVNAGGLKQMSDVAELRTICERIIQNNRQQVEQYKAGKDKLFGFFVGQAMKQTKGKGNPQIINDTFKELLRQ